MLDAIVQMPNNLFYNTGITTYIWLLNNNKPKARQGKVQLIDAGQLYRKLRKNLGNKNCEFAPEHISEIIDTYTDFKTIKREDETGIATQVFDNADFGYYKVTVERPKRLSAQFTKERIETLRFDKSLKEPMQWAYTTFGETVYSNIDQHKDAITEWLDKNDINLSSANKTKLLKQATWNKHQTLVEEATSLMDSIGTTEFNDFNTFKTTIDTHLKATKSKLGASEKKAILNAVSWYDATAEKVIKSKTKFKTEKLNDLLAHLGCKVNHLADYGYYATKTKNEFINYEHESDLRDTENVPLKENIHTYFLKEVKPHVEEAWINLDMTKIGYEISFNKYFYQHTPLRELNVVANEILELEKENEGLIMDILNLA